MKLECVGTPRYPGCRVQFEATHHRQRYCPDCAGLDRPSSFVFVERRLALQAQQAQHDEED